MKFWFGYGSEHSWNLVMIGRFTTATDASRAKDVIDQLAAKVQEEVAANRISFGGETSRFSDEMLEFLKQVKVYNVGPSELEQFASDVSVEQKANEIVIRTDECDVSAFLKVLIDEGAKIEAFSAHHHPEVRNN